MTAAWALILVFGGYSFVATNSTYFTTLDMCSVARAKVLQMPASRPGTWAAAECVLVGPGLKGDEGVPAFSPLKQKP